MFKRRGLYERVGHWGSSQSSIQYMCQFLCQLNTFCFKTKTPNLTQSGQSNTSKERSHWKYSLVAHNIQERAAEIKVSNNDFKSLNKGHNISGDMMSQHIRRLTFPMCELCLFLGLLHSFMLLHETWGLPALRFTTLHLRRVQDLPSHLQKKHV